MLTHHDPARHQQRRAPNWLATPWQRGPRGCCALISECRPTIYAIHTARNTGLEICPAAPPRWAAPWKDLLDSRVPVCCCEHLLESPRPPRRAVPPAAGPGTTTQWSPASAAPASVAPCAVCPQAGGIGSLAWRACLPLHPFAVDSTGRPFTTSTVAGTPFLTPWPRRPLALAFFAAQCQA